MDEKKTTGKFGNLEAQGDLRVDGLTEQAENAAKEAEEAEKKARVLADAFYKEPMCMPLMAIYEGKLCPCIKDRCVCFWDKTNEECLINECLYAFFVKTNWNLRLDMATKLDASGNRVPRNKGDFQRLADIMKDFAGVFGL